MGIDHLSHPKKLADIQDTNGNYLRVEKVDDRIMLLAGFNLTADNYHVLEYICNELVGLEQPERIAFKMEAKRAL